MSKQDQNSIRHFSIGSRQYSLERANRALLDDHGEEAIHLINETAGHFVFSAELEDRALIVAYIAMHIDADRRERNERPLTDQESAEIASSFEFAMANVEATDLINRKIREYLGEESSEDPDQHSEAPPRNLLGRYTKLAAAIAFVTFACCVFYWQFAPPPPAPTTIVPLEAAEKPFDYGSLTKDRRQGIAIFDPAVVAVAAHPTQRAFITADVYEAPGQTIQFRILLERANLLDDRLYTTQPLAETAAPAYWVHIAADGSEAVVCDWSGTITHLSLTSTQLPEKIQPANRPGMAYALGNGEILIVDANTRRARLHGTDRTIPMDALNAMPANSQSRVLAWEQDRGATRLLTIASPDRTLLTRRLGPQQRLRAFDASNNTAVLLLDNGTVAIYRLPQTGPAELIEEFTIGREFAHRPYVRISRDGDAVWMATPLGVQLLNLIDLKFLGSANLEGGEALAAAVHTDRDDEILLAHNGVGYVYAEAEPQ